MLNLQNKITLQNLQVAVTHKQRGERIINEFYLEERRLSSILNAFVF